MHGGRSTMRRQNRPEFVRDVTNKKLDLCWGRFIIPNRIDCRQGPARNGIDREPRHEGDTMKATQLLHNLGQSIWLDNITRDLLDSGTLQHYINDLSVTGLTSN